MSEQTTPDPEASREPEARPVGDAVQDAGVGAAAGADDDVAQRGAEGLATQGTDDDAPFWRKVPIWGWIVAGVVVLAGAVVAVLAATGAFTPAPLPTPPAATVTAEPPTPTAEPIERELEPTAFSAALPDTVLDLVLAEMSEGGRWAEGEVEALEAYALVFSDGGAKNVTLDAAQFADEEAAQRALPEVMADFETGEVTAGGAVVGEFWIAPAGEGVATVMWRNTTAVFVLEGDEEVVRDVFRAFPL